MQSVPWHDQYAPYSHMMKIVRSGNFAHAYLFTGPAGTGKRTLASFCAKAMLCTETEKPCGACAPCKRVESGNHPDVITVNEPGEIKIETIRGLIDLLTNSAYEGGYRAVVINGAERMNAHAQNALLKTLETPPRRTVFFLISASPAALLATIKSRCQVIRFGLLSTAEIKKMLAARGIEPSRAAILAELSHGSPGRALELNQSESYWQQRARVGEALKLLSDPANISAAYQHVSDRKNADVIFSIIEGWARGIMLTRETGAKYIQDDLPDLHNHKPSFGADVLQSVLSARQRHGSNVTWQSNIEILFLDIAGG